MNMNTPNDEMIDEAVRCIIKQNKHEICELLFPLSIKFGFILNSEYVIIKLSSSCESLTEDKFGYKLPLDYVYGTYVNDVFLYIKCYRKVLYVLDMENGLWRRYLPMYQPPLLKVFWWRIQEIANALMSLSSHRNE